MFLFFFLLLILQCTPRHVTSPIERPPTFEYNFEEPPKEDLKTLSKQESKPQKIEPKEQPLPFQRPVFPQIIGCILPLTGPGKEVGARIKRGMDLAIEILQTRGTSFKILYRDSKGEAESAEFWTQELTQKQRVIGIIGPVMKDAAKAAAQKAQELKIPIILLSIKEDLPKAGHYIFRNFITNKAEVKLLTTYAITTLNLERFAVLYPDNSYGEKLKELFIKQVSLAQKTIVTEINYPEDKTSFAEEAQKLLEFDFQALFIPDRAKKIGLIAPTLAAFGIWSADLSTKKNRQVSEKTKKIQILSPSVGYHPNLIKIAGRYLQGAIFSTGFFPDEDSLYTKEFIELFQEKYEELPTMYEAFGHDATILLTELINRGNLTRAQIRQGLAKIKSGRFIAPFCGFTNKGEPLCPVILVQLQKERFKVILKK
jgi:ABC-type branched-subunit amino acid transport system substrate-binding protein